MCDKAREFARETIKASAANNGLSEESTAQLLEYCKTKFEEMKAAGVKTEGKTEEDAKCFIAKCLEELHTKITDASEQEKLKKTIEEAFAVLKAKKEQCAAQEHTH